MRLLSRTIMGACWKTLAIVPEQRSGGIGAALAYRALASLNIGNGRTADSGSRRPTPARAASVSGSVLPCATT